MGSLMRQLLLAGSAAVAVGLTAGATQAAVVQGNSGGTFSNLAAANSCDDGGRCQIENTANGNNTRVRWGYDQNCFLFFCSPDTSTGSTLTAVDRSWNVNTNANGVVIAELVWFNDSTKSNQTPDSFSVDYTLQIAFTNPVGGDTELFNLLIVNPTNPPGDNVTGLTVADLANLSFTLAGVTVGDIHYVADLAGGSTFGNGVWFNPEDNAARLFILADFSAPTPPVQVPAPAALGLFGVGLAGLGLATRRRRAG